MHWKNLPWALLGCVVALILCAVGGWLLSWLIAWNPEVKDSAGEVVVGWDLALIRMYLGLIALGFGTGVLKILDLFVFLMRLPQREACDGR